MPESQHHHFPVTAVMLIIATGTLLGGMDATAKYLALEVPVIMVLWGRYFFHTAITFGYYSYRTRSLGFLRARRPGMQLFRASCLFGATFFLYEAVTRMQLGDASAIQFLAPVLVTAFSGVLLGEHVGLRRWIAVGIGFTGVLLVARPGYGVLGWDALLPLATAFLLAGYMTMTRLIRDKDDPGTTTFYSTAVGTIVLSVLVIIVWKDLSSFEWLLMVTMGTAGAVGHFMLVKAFHSAEASMLAPFTYSQVVASIAWGFIIFGDIPSSWTLAGAGIVIGSGLYIWYRESKSPPTVARS